MTATEAASVVKMSKLSCDELVEYIAAKFNFSPEVVNKFRGMTLLLSCIHQLCINV